MEYSLLGPLEVRDDGRTIPIGRGKPRALLALLLLNAGRVVPAERLIDELWADEPPPTATTALQVYVSKLRKALGEGAIRTQPPGYSIETADLDVRRFERLVADARRLEPSEAAPLYREALALWRGTPLCDVDLPVEAARLEELRLAATERWIDAELALGNAAEVVPELESLVAAHPLREAFRAQLMHALYASGRQAEALDAYRSARRTLVDELGIEPGARLQELEQAILRQDAALAPGAQRTTTATVVFLDLGVRGSVEATVEPALAAAIDALSASALRVERGLADAVQAAYAEADDAIAAAVSACERLASFGESVAPRAGVATAELTLADRATGAAAVLAARRVRDAKPGEIAAGERTAAAATAHTFRRRGDCYILTR